METGNTAAVLDGEIDDFIDGRDPLDAHQETAASGDVAAAQRAELQCASRSTKASSSRISAAMISCGLSPGELVVDVSPGSAAGGAAALHHRPGAVCADQVFAAHRNPFRLARVLAVTSRVLRP